MTTARRISFGRPSTRGLMSRGFKATKRSTFAVGQVFSNAMTGYTLRITAATDLPAWVTSDGIHTDSSLRELLAKHRATLVV